MLTRILKLDFPKNKHGFNGFLIKDKLSLKRHETARDLRVRERNLAEIESLKNRSNQASTFTPPAIKT
jgi:hypothetical protein